MSDAISVYAFNVEVIKSSVQMVVVLLIIPALDVIGYLYKRINQQRTFWYFLRGAKEANRSRHTDTKTAAQFEEMRGQS